MVWVAQEAPDLRRLSEMMTARDAEERGLRSAKRQRGTPRLFAMEADEEEEELLTNGRLGVQDGARLRPQHMHKELQ